VLSINDIRATPTAWRRILQRTVVVFAALGLGHTPVLAQGIARSIIDAASPLRCGKTATGSLAANERQNFWFSVQPGEMIAVEAVEISGSGELLHLRLGGTGVRISTCTGRIDPSSTPLRFESLEGGPYILSVGDCNSDSSVEYSVSWHLISDSDRNCGRALRCGAVFETELAAPGEVDAFRFAALRGDNIALALDSTDGVRGGLEVRIFDPLGRPVDSAERAVCATAPTFRAETSGMYTVLVNACRGTATGSYTISWLDDACTSFDRTQTPTPNTSMTPPATPVPVLCAGDCDQDGRITVNEIVLLVSSSLGLEADECAAGDIDGNGRVTVDEVVTAVNNALNGCRG